MKHSILACLVMIASSAFCATQTSKEYVDIKASNTLVTAKSYTDTKAAEVTALIPNTNDFLSASWTNGSVIVAGYGASASGGVNTVVGMGAKAEGVGATAYGEMCRAIGQHAIAWGSARALGDYCVAMGLDAEAAVAYSIAIGEQARAIQQYTYAIGSHAMASNYNAFVVGNQSKALGQDAMAVGNRAQALDYRTMAVGLDSSANGWNAMSVGSSSLAHGLSSFAAGTASLAYGTYATALGMMACASNSSAVAIGYNSKALHNSSMSLGANSKSTGYNSVALGSSTEANQSSVAIGPGAKASGQQSVAIGRDAKATHTAAVAIGPTAETTGDGTIRIAYNPSEIMLGFWQPKSLRAYLDEVTPTIDWGIASNIVRNADFLPSKYYYVYRGTTNQAARWEWSTLGMNNQYSTTLSLVPANSDSFVGMNIGEGAMISFKNGGRLSVLNGGEMRVYDPDSITFGSGQNQTNFNNYVKAIARSAGGGVADLTAATNYTDAAVGAVSNATWAALVSKRELFDLSVYTNGFDMSAFESRIPSGGKIGYREVFAGEYAIMWYPDASDPSYHDVSAAVTVVNPFTQKVSLMVTELLGKYGEQYFYDLLGTTHPQIPIASSHRITTTTDLTAATNGLASVGYVDTENTTTRAIVATWENFLDGSNVVFSITNYISGSYNLDTAKFRILEMTNNVYREVYNSRSEIVMHIDDFKTNDFRIATNQVITSVDSKIAGKADRAWGKYTSTGYDVSDVYASNTVYMTEPTTVFAGGTEYARFAVGEGAICILTTKGAPVYTTGEEGTFKFQDNGGTNYFGFARSDSYTIGANASGITVNNQIVTITYDIVSGVVPCIWYIESLDDYDPTDWEQLNLPTGEPVPGASHGVSWEPNPPEGKRICYINVTGEAKGFFRATVEVAGSAKFITNMPADLIAGIVCTNTAAGKMGTIVPSYNGSSVIWTWREN